MSAVIFATIVMIILWTMLVVLFAYHCGRNHERAADNGTNLTTLTRTITELSLARGQVVSLAPQRAAPVAQAPRHIPDPSRPAGFDDERVDPAGLEDGPIPIRRGSSETHRPRSVEATIPG